MRRIFSLGKNLGMKPNTTANMADFFAWENVGMAPNTIARKTDFSAFLMGEISEFVLYLKCVYNIDPWPDP